MNDKKTTNITGLQIGGTVGKNDIVGMYIVMPKTPGTGVKVEINEIDVKVQEIIDTVEDTDVNSELIKQIGNQILSEKDQDNKLRLTGSFVSLASGIASIAHHVLALQNILTP